MIPPGQKKIEPVIFLGRRTDPEIKSFFKKYSLTVESIIIDRWFMRRFSEFVFKATGRNWMIEFFLLKRFGVKVISHSGFLLDENTKIKNVNWLPDFQHIHLKEMFSGEEYEKRNRLFAETISKSDGVIVSSESAYGDLKRFMPQADLKKVSVLKFVPFLEKEIFDISNEEILKIRNKYGIGEKFFYLPNQFWKHKNHITVLKAVNELKKEKFKIEVACSGSLDDYRNSAYIAEIKSYIENNGLHDYVKLLGVIPYREVQILFKCSDAVINPSLFEGWSTTVEECKIMGKKCVLSDIEVHREQAPSGAHYFKPDDYLVLADILKGLASEKPSECVPHDELIAANESNLIKFALEYQKIILNLF